MTRKTLEIKHRETLAVLYSSETARTTAEAVVEAVQSGADLRGANLRWANLRWAYLRGAKLPTSVKIDDLDDKVLAAIADGGKLDMSDWHTCKTMHCRAGWAITLAGGAGRVLEDIYGPSVAGALIYAASYPDLPVPDFMATNEDAMADIRARAAIAKEA